MFVGPFVWFPWNKVLKNLNFFSTLSASRTSCPRTSVTLSVEEEMLDIFPLDESRILNVNIFPIRSGMILFKALYLLIRMDLSYLYRGRERKFLLLNDYKWVERHRPCLDENALPQKTHDDLSLVIFAMGKDRVLLCLNSRGLGIPSYYCLGAMWQESL